MRSVAITALATLDAEPGGPPGGTSFATPDEAPTAPDVPLPAAVVHRAYDAAADRLALAAEDKLIYLLDPTRGMVVHRLRGHAGVVTAMAFSPDGHLLATASDDQTLRLWEVRSGRELLVCDAAAPTLRWSADGAWLALGPDRTLRLLAPTVVQHFIPEREDSRTEELVTIDLSADGRWLVTVGEGGTRLWDTRTRRDVALFPKDRAEWSAARFSPDSQRLWIGGWNSKLRVLDVIEDDQPRPAGEFAGALYTQSADGAWLAAVSNGGGGFQCVSTAAPRRVVWLRHAHPLSLAFSPDGTRAATSSYDSGGVQVWDFPAGKTRRTLPVEPPAQLAFTADGAQLATATGSTVTLWNPATGERTGHFTTIAPIERLAFHPDGKSLALETRHGLALHHAVAPYDLLARLELAPYGAAASFCFSRDGRQLAVQTATGGAIVWQLDTLAREFAALGMERELPSSTGHR
jgi:WD40 repeat protein